MQVSEDKYKLQNRFYICKFHHVKKRFKNFNYEHLEAINIVTGSGLALTININHKHQL